MIQEWDSGSRYPPLAELGVVRDWDSASRHTAVIDPEEPELSPPCASVTQRFAMLSALYVCRLSLPEDPTPRWVQPLSRIHGVISPSDIEGPQ